MYVKYSDLVSTPEQVKDAHKELAIKRLYDCVNNKSEKIIPFIEEQLVYSGGNVSISVQQFCGRFNVDIFPVEKEIIELYKKIGWNVRAKSTENPQDTMLVFSDIPFS